MFTPFTTVYLVTSLPEIPYIHRVYMVLADPNSNARNVTHTGHPCTRHPCQSHLTVSTLTWPFTTLTTLTILTTLTWPSNLTWPFPLLCLRNSLIQLGTGEGWRATPSTRNSSDAHRRDLGWACGTRQPQQQQDVLIRNTSCKGQLLTWNNWYLIHGSHNNSKMLSYVMQGPVIDMKQMIMNTRQPQQQQDVVICHARVSYWHESFDNKYTAATTTARCCNTSCKRQLLTWNSWLLNQMALFNPCGGRVLCYPIQVAHFPSLLWGMVFIASGLLFSSSNGGKAGSCCMQVCQEHSHIQRPGVSHPIFIIQDASNILGARLNNHWVHAWFHHSGC